MKDLKVCPQKRFERPPPWPTLKDTFEQIKKSKVKKLFEDGPLEATKEDIFEQMVNFTLSEQCLKMKELIYELTDKRKTHPFAC